MLTIPAAVVPKENWQELLKHSRLNYHGDVVQRAVRLTWVQVEPGLPPPEHCAIIYVEELADGPMLDFLQNTLH